MDGIVHRMSLTIHVAAHGELSRGDLAGLRALFDGE